MEKNEATELPPLPPGALRIDVNGRTYEGAPLAIVRAMQAESFTHAGGALADYITWMVESVKSMTREAIAIPAGTDEERSNALVQGLLFHHLAKPV